MKKTMTRPKSKQPQKTKLEDLYEPDEVAWLEQSVELIKEKRFNDLDYINLEEFLDSMAKSQRREVKSRLRTLIVHLLKWRYQPELRSGGWEATIIHQREELEDIFTSTTLRNHALEVLPKAYAGAQTMAALETGLEKSEFPKVCPYSLEYLLSEQLPESDEPE